MYRQVNSNVESLSNKLLAWEPDSIQYNEQLVHICMYLKSSLDVQHEFQQQTWCDPRVCVCKKRTYAAESETLNGFYVKRAWDSGSFIRTTVWDDRASLSVRYKKKRNGLLQCFFFHYYWNKNLIVLNDKSQASLCLWVLYTKKKIFKWHREKFICDSAKESDPCFWNRIPM